MSRKASNSAIIRVYVAWALILAVGSVLLVTKQWSIVPWAIWFGYVALGVAVTLITKKGA